MLLLAPSATRHVRHGHCGVIAVCGSRSSGFGVHRCLQMRRILRGSVTADWDSNRRNVHVWRDKRICRNPRWLGIRYGLCCTSPRCNALPQRALRIGRPFWGNAVARGSVRTRVGIPEEAIGLRDRGLSVRSLHTPASPVVALLEHVLARWIERPVITLPFAAAFAWLLDEALVQRQVVSDRVLPAFFVLLVKRELRDDILVDAVQREPFFRRLSNCHRNQGDVRIRGLHVRILVLLRLFRRRRCRTTSGFFFVALPRLVLVRDGLLGQVRLLVHLLLAGSHPRVHSIPASCSKVRLMLKKISHTLDAFSPDTAAVQYPRGRVDDWSRLSFLALNATL